MKNWDLTEEEGNSARTKWWVLGRVTSFFPVTARVPTFIVMMTVRVVGRMSRGRLLLKDSACCVDSDFR